MFQTTSLPENGSKADKTGAAVIPDDEIESDEKKVFTNDDPIEDENVANKQYLTIGSNTVKSFVRQKTKRIRKTLKQT